jgi:hypothetical protein
VLFGILYPAVVEQEERRLKEIFGDVYEAYCRKVPRWIPRWSLYSEPETVVVSTKRMRQAILDGMWYPWAFALAEVIEVLRDHGALRYLF